MITDKNSRFLTMYGSEKVIDDLMDDKFNYIVNRYHLSKNPHLKEKLNSDDL